MVTLLLIVGFLLIWEIVANGTIATDLTSLATFVGAVASLFVTAGVTKARGDSKEVKTTEKDKDLILQKTLSYARSNNKR